MVDLGMVAGPSTGVTVVVEGHVVEVSYFITSTVEIPRARRAKRTTNMMQGLVSTVDTLPLATVGMMSCIDALDPFTFCEVV